MKVKDLNRNEMIALLKINYKTSVEDLNFRSRRISAAPDEESRKAWERRWKATTKELIGFENAMKCMGIRVVRTYKDHSFYSEITNFEFIEF